MIFLALRNLAARKRRTLLTALAIIVGVAQVAGALVLTDSMNKTIDTLFESGQKGVDVVVSPRVRTTNDGSAPPTIAPEVLTKVQSVDGVKTALGQTFATVQMLKKDSDSSITVGPPSIIASQDPPDFSSFSRTAGRDATAPGEVTVEKSTAERGGYVIGDKLRIVGPSGLSEEKIVGLMEYAGGSLGGLAVAFAIPDEAQRISGNGGRFDQVGVQADKGVTAAQLRVRVAAAVKGEPVNVRTREQEAHSQAEDLKSALSFLSPVLLAFAGIALFVGSFVIVNTFAATLAQRSQELAMLRTLGATRQQLQRSVLLEAGITGLVAGLIGLGAGLLVAPGILALFSSFGIDLPAQGTVVLPRTIIVSLLLGVGVTLIAAWRPVRRATAVPPIQAMRGLDTGQAKADQRPGLAAFAVAATAVAAVIGSLVTTGTAAALLVVAAALLTFLAVAMFAPIVLGPLMRALGVLVAWRGPAGRLARLNAVREPRRTATTAGALMVGVALVTFVAIFAAGIGALVRDTFGDRMKAPLALSGSGVQNFPAAAQELVAADPGVERAVGIAFGSYGLKGGASTQLAGVDPGLASVYKLDWVDGSNATLDQLGKDGVVVDVKAGEPQIKALKVGDTITMTDATKSLVTLKVKGLVSEGNTILGGGLIGPRTLVEEATKHDDVALSLLALKPGADAETVQTRVEPGLKAKYPTVKALTRDELGDQFVGQVNQLVNMIYAFLAFALLVSLLGISTTFGLAVQERRRELGILRAVGMTRRQVRTLIRLEAILIGLVGAILGIAIGIAFGGLSSHLLSDQGIRFVIPTGTLIVVVIASAVVAALAAGRPARRAGKVNVVEVLTTE